MSSIKAKNKLDEQRNSTARLSHGNPIDVSTQSFSDLFDGKKTIVIPEYQRPYTWTNNKADELLEDLEEFCSKEQTSETSYYMGSILLFNNQNDSVFEVIDGQQRLTTLLILQSIIEEELNELYDLQLNGHTSFNKVREVHAFFELHKDRIDHLSLKIDIFSDIDFTVIICSKEDLAFTFFDTQNNRGVSLSADDYLKAYHLRAVQSEELQDQLAQEWEHAALLSQDEETKHLTLSYLFYQLLYKGREWKGQSDLEPESKDELLNTFQKKTHRTSADNQFPLYPNPNNIKYTAATFNSKPVAWVESKQEVAHQVDYPFSIRQPLYKGQQFFMYTRKYYEIHRLIFDLSDEAGCSEEIKTVREFYSKVYTSQMSPYLKAFMQLCVVVYYDVFNDQGLYKAVQYFDYFIGSMRLSKYYVRKEAVKNSLMGAKNNLLDVICHAYLPSEVFDFIASEPSIKPIYQNMKLDNLNTIRLNYISRLENYYGDNFEIHNRISWVR